MNQSVVDNAILSAERYADDVLSGRILACKWIKLAVKRHKDDLKNCKGYYFDPKDASKVIAFFCCFLSFSKGKWSGKNFVPEPWQCFILWCLFGWKKNDGTRRFRRAYIQVARKNGKTELMAGIMLYVSWEGAKEGSDVYSVATKKDQAKISFNAAKQMLKSSKSLKKRLIPWKNQIEAKHGSGTLEALGSDADTLDGLNPSLVIIDEYHAHRNDSVYDVMWSAMGARENPLMIVITTAGLNLTYPCYMMERDCKGVLEKRFKDDSLFVAIYQLDEEDTKAEEKIVNGKKITKYNWANETNYIKANPNLGVSVKLEDLMQERDVALRLLSKRREFLTKKCNMWYDAPDTWIKAENWQMAGWEVSTEELRGLDAYIGIDLAQTQDITALAMIIPYNDILVLKCWCFIPQTTIDERVSSGLITLYDWIEQGYVIPTEGNATDYTAIEEKINELRNWVNIKGGHYDQFNATHLVTRLESEYGMDNLYKIAQTPTNLGAATKDFEMGILQRTINHCNNPVLGWMANNVVTRSYPSGLYVIDKRKSNDYRVKVDGISASIMALNAFQAISVAGGNYVEVW